ncbi:MAG: hypothetical protein WCJ53_05470 [Mycobacteriaceae bacterium]
MYRNAFWVRKGARAYTGIGMFGQYCYIDVPSRVVIARFSSFTTPVPAAESAETVRSFDAIAEAAR